MSSTEVLEANVIAIREELKEFKADFREHKQEIKEDFHNLRAEFKELRDEFKDHKKEFSAAIARLDNDIKSAASDLRAEIRAMAAKAESDLKQFASRVDDQLREMRAEYVILREKVDKNHAEVTGKIEVTNANVVQLGKEVHAISTKLNTLIWLVSVIAAVILFFMTVGKDLGWFKSAAAG